MHRTRIGISATILLLACALSAVAQQSSDVTVPTIVNFSGTLTDVNGKPLTGIVGVTFYLYQDQQGGAPLWIETQNVQPDRMGHYSVMLGSTTSQGLSPDLFASGQARWLGVQAQGQEEQPRVMLLSVPYAMKAVDAQTIGGLPPSAFVLAAPPTANAARAVGGSKAASVPATSSDVTTTGGTADKIPMFTAATKIQNSILSQTGTTAINVGGNLNLPATGRFEIGNDLFAFGSSENRNAFLGFAGNTTTTGGGDNTATGYAALAYNTTGENNTAIGGSALFSNYTGSSNTAVGAGALYHNTMGEAQEPGQASSNTAVGTGALSGNTTGSYNTATGEDALYSNTTSVANTASGYQALYSNGTSSYNDAFGYQALFSQSCTATPCDGYNDAFGYQALYSNQGQENAAFGYQALYSNIDEDFNTAVGYQALYSNTGANNTAVGWSALYASQGGQANTAIGNQALGYYTGGGSNTGVGNNSGVTADESLATGSYNTFLGNAAGMSTGSLSNATAIGSCALVSASSALVLGAPTNACGQTSNTQVGIDVSNPSNILTVLQGGGPAIADGWSTYSSRRWKTNIHPLQNALSKVEQLRGVSYDLKDSGKHEIGVIAEEVGQVVPEVVSYEKNGKDATGVDYSRLTALLIEAVKQQQKQVVAQQKQIALQQSQIRKQQRLVTTQQHEIAGLSRKVGVLESSLRSSHGETASVLVSRAKTDSATLLP
jgi:hypothetical protein